MSAQQLPKGTYVPLVTPFTKDDEVDYAALDALLQKMLAAEVEALVMLGTTGESPTVTNDEFTGIIERTLEQTQEKTVVLAGIGTNDTRTTVAQACIAEALGVDGLLVTCPYYNKPMPAGIQRHYQTVADAVTLPLLIYNIGGRTGVNIGTETLLALSEHPNIVGVKEASDNINQIGDVLHQASSDFLVLSGCDHLNYPLMCLGGHGVISTLANIMPVEVKALVDAALKGEYVRARNLHFQLLSLAYGCFLETNPIPVKTALALMGEIEEVFRLPMAAMQPDTREQWQAILMEYGLLTTTNADEIAA